MKIVISRNNKIMLLDALLNWNYLHIGDCSAIPLWEEDIVNVRSMISRAVGNKMALLLYKPGIAYGQIVG
ncbi:hypothetical protein DPMN_076829 [Dreissena polymorpha]|uniref:Uncharacterized protein n=1 Tax=Dreissena polymorpha TaxID=45954 RepID=A0A9D3YPD8_DREPO|nr:hypothetical protein DPMN_076829 [Dreissena polymorpha]